jgi:DNA invertase Pin-like site-specific DNA recombinase
MQTIKIATQAVAEPPPGKKYGYVRISMRHQKEDRQIAALLAQGVPRRNIFVDKQSGKDFAREKYQLLLRKIKPGDCVFVEELDRFGRNYDEIIENWQLITKKMGVDIVVLECSMLDTRAKGKDLTGRFISDVVLALLSYLAEMERRKNHQRQAEGIAIAKAKGVKFGRPALDREAFHFLYETWLSGDISGRAAARTLGVAQKTFINWAEERSATVSE